MGARSDDASAEINRALAGRYRVERELGRGGMAVVYLARDLKHGREVALKLLRPELTSSGFSLERFSREVRIAASLQHPNILPLYDSGDAGGRVFYVMPFVPGESLRARMTREKRLPVDEALRLTGEMAAGLAYAHEQGVVHRDIKPENVLLSDGRAIIADFGIARAIGADVGDKLTQTGHSVGTPAYMSPEQASGETNIDGRSDIYSLACVTYEMLAGEAPFAGATAQAIIARHIQQDAPSVRIVRKTVPPETDAAILKAMAKSAVDRYPSATAFAAALTDVTGSHAAVAGRRGQRRSWPRTAAIAALAVAVALGGRAAWSRWGPAPSLDPDLVAVAPYDVADPTLAPLAQGLLDALARNLNGAGPLRAVSPSVASAAWSGRADEASAVSLARRTAARTSIVGTVSRLGADSVRVTTSLFDVASRRPIADLTTSAPASRMDRVADSLTVAILGAIGRVRPLGSTRPPSAGAGAMAALKSYLVGETYYRRALFDSAQRHYERAVQLDSAYALAYHRLSYVRTRRSAGNDSLIWFNGMRAGRLARGLPERDSLVVTIDSIQAASWYYAVVQSARGRDSAAAVLHPRLFSTLEIATRRFPDDPEFWFALSENLTNFGNSRGHGRERENLDALNRAIRLDSAYLPAYLRAFRLVAMLDGADSLRRYVSAYLSRDPAEAASEAARLISVLLDPRRANGPEAERRLAAAPPRVLLDTWLALFWWYDSAQTALRVVSRLRAHPDANLLSPIGDDYLRILHSMTLGSRGRVREACQLFRPEYVHRYSYPQLALLGCAPPASASAVFVAMMTGERWQPSLISLHVPWFAAIRDTARLADFRRRGDDAVRTTADPASVAHGRFLSESAQAYLALVRGDSATALRHFLNAPDSLCLACDAQRLDKARVLVAAKRDRDALDLLNAETDGAQFALSFVMRLARARLSEKLGDRAVAISDYRRVATAWADGDPAMRDSARVAREALQRLGAR